MSQDKPRVFVVGAGGFLGSHAARVLREKFTVIPGKHFPSGADDVAIDIREVSSVNAAFDAARPNIVVLLAAMSDIDRCETAPAEAHAVNVQGTAHVAEACIRSGARLLFVSTAAVFDGKAHGYAEDSLINPVSVYGKTKAEAENLVLKLGAAAIVVRVALVLGFAGKADTNSMMDGFAKRWMMGESIALPTYEQRNPIDAETCCEFMADLLTHAQTQGIFHIGSSDVASRYEIGLRVAVRMGYRGLVRPLSEPIPGRAPRGADHFLLTDKLRAHCARAIPTCDQVIARCFGGSTKSQV